MDGILFATAATVAGALAYDVWGFLQAKREADDSEEEERFDPVIAMTTCLPSLLLAVSAGFALNVQAPVGWVAILVQGFTLASSGFGMASAGRKLGVNSFFRTKR